MSLASIDGQVGPAGEARIPVTDEGLLRGDGADGLRFDIAVRRLRLPPYRGEAGGFLPVNADRHLQALRAAAKG